MSCNTECTTCSGSCYCNNDTSCTYDGITYYSGEIDFACCLYSCESGSAIITIIDKNITKKYIYDEKSNYSYATGLSNFVKDLFVENNLLIPLNNFINPIAAFIPSTEYSKNLVVAINVLTKKLENNEISLEEYNVELKKAAEDETKLYAEKYAQCWIDAYNVYTAKPTIQESYFSNSKK